MTGVAAARATPSLRIGQARDGQPHHARVFKNFSIEVGETLSKLSLSIKSLSTAVDPNVVAGVNLRNALGVLTFATGTDQIGFQSDSLHMNNATLTLVSEAWRDTLATAGVAPVPK